MADAGEGGENPDQITIRVKDQVSQNAMRVENGRAKLSECNPLASQHGNVL